MLNFLGYVKKVMIFNSFILAFSVHDFWADFLG